MATAYFLAACLELPMTNRASVSKRPAMPATLGMLYRSCRHLCDRHHRLTLNVTRSLLPERDQHKDLHMPAVIYVHIVGDSETTIWGLTGRERLQRMLRPFKQVSLVANPDQIPAHALALFLRARSSV